MVKHFVLICVVIALGLLCMLYPFLPGEYDAMAVPMSTAVQLFAVLGLLLVPIGILWLVYELRKQRRRNRNLPNTARGYYFALASLIAASIVAILVSLLLFLANGLLFGVLSLTLWFYAVSRLRPRLGHLKEAEDETINPAPFYLILIPVALLVIQMTLAGPAAEFSRSRAIANSAELIREIEANRAVNARYPASLLAVWRDYYPAVVGIEGFHYAPSGDGYNLFFEQPRFLLDNLGTREFVVYNPQDAHVIPSHAGWILLWSPEVLAARQGWYSAHETSSPHWKYFWFD